MSKPFGRWEFMRPDDLEEIVAAAPVAYVPLGTFEHHGWHLPVCFDAVKAHALCLRAARETGGAVLPAFFYGTGGGHIGYKWTVIVEEERIRPLLETTLDHLARFGFKVVAILTGHYPSEQVQMARRLAEEAGRRNPATRYIGLTEPEITTPMPGDAFAGDHAAKYETSIALALDPSWVRLDWLKGGREASEVAFPDTPTGPHDPAHPLYAIYGQDPRRHASAEAGERMVQEIVSRLRDMVMERLEERD
ncbi:MAG: creatininase family protein [Armatimonadetes bacterium]|nr:creatininase family protein [Armatimonadota bacterium]